MNTNNIDLMIDIETLATNATYPMIAQIGAVLFDPNTGETWDEKSWNINIKKSRGAMEPDTVMFWLGQSREAIDAVFFSSPRVPLGEALADLKTNYIDKAKCVWSRSTNFDLKILSDVAAFEMAEVNFKEYIPFRKWREERVMRDLLDTHGVTVPKRGIGHNALDDCHNQVSVVVTARDLFRRGLSAVQDRQLEVA